MSKEKASMPLDELAALAKRCGYGALCMRASQVGVHSAPEEVERAVECLADSGLAVSMITGDFDTVYNNENGPNALRNITPYLRLAKRLGAPRIRVALKQESDIEYAKRAADEAAEQDVQLVHQCHTLSLFETVESIEQTLRAIDRPNFGLVYEPANLRFVGRITEGNDQAPGQMDIQCLSPKPSAETGWRGHATNLVRRGCVV